MSRKLQLFLENLGQLTVPEDESNNIPEQLIPTLYPYQKFGLYFMKNAEESSNKGGILADDMGLGKTIQTIALITACPPLSDNTTSPPTPIPTLNKNKSNHKNRLMNSKATLIVCPVSLLSQWESELSKKIYPPPLVCVHHGPNRTKNSQKLAEFDIIITTYSIITTEIGTPENRGTLGSLKYHRVILDEAHEIKNQKTNKAKACFNIESTYRWCLTATPIQNEIGDLYSLIKFLRIEPYNDEAEFKESIKKPFDKLMISNDDEYNEYDNDELFQRLQVLFKSIALRRSKNAKIDDKPIVDLPAKHIYMIHIDFNSGERIFYDSVAKRAQARLEDAVGPDGKKLKVSYNKVLALLTKLRRVCLHPRLVGGGEDSPNDIQWDEYELLDKARTIPRDTVKRIIKKYSNGDQATCPLCMDVAVSPKIIPMCGHLFCEECLNNYITLFSRQNEEQHYNCSECNNEFILKDIISLEVFFKVHSAGLYEEYFNHHIIDKEIRVEDLPTSTKIDKMLEILKQSRKEAKDDKTVIFSQFTSFLDLLEEPLKEHGFKFLRLDGKTPAGQRSKMINTFQKDPKYKIFLISLKAGGVGLNLTAANRVILMDIWWNPAIENQAIDRVHRIGQKKEVHVHRLFINQSIEDTILQLQEKKQKLYESTLAEGENMKKLDTLSVPEIVHLFQNMGLDN
ncbi:hypothetical protein INT45_004407 [Circinella minor]|uniref:DNA repair protein RAD5 n=1 Tax=Circinella minor TaxID=1195481 RepID=A0A8H7SA91_9FUNG|nr:hypothetical protein INT45_004407 [Circinella minor]